MERTSTCAPKALFVPLRHRAECLLLRVRTRCMYIQIASRERRRSVCGAFIGSLEASKLFALVDACINMS